MTHRISTRRDVFFLSLLLMGAMLPVARTSARVLFCSATDLTMNEYCSTNSRVRGRLRVERLFVDHEHWGFFRIGFLPVLVADNVKMEMPTAECLCNGLADLQSPSESGRPVSEFELRRVEISTGGERRCLVRAATGRFETGGNVRLSTVSVRNGAGHSFDIDQATLLVSGRDAGCLCWMADGRQKTFYLFSPSTEKIP